LQHQSGVLRGSQLEHEILGKTSQVAPDLLVEPGGGYVVKCGELGIEQHLVAAEHKDGLRYALDRGNRFARSCRHRNTFRLDRPLPALPGRGYHGRRLEPKFALGPERTISRQELIQPRRGIPVFGKRLRFFVTGGQ